MVKSSCALPAPSHIAHPTPVPQENTPQMSGEANHCDLPGVLFFPSDCQQKEKYEQDGRFGPEFYTSKPLESNVMAFMNHTKCCSEPPHKA